jgi:hypothetical protein
MLQTWYQTAPRIGSSVSGRTIVFQAVESPAAFGLTARSYAPWQSSTTPGGDHISMGEPPQLPAQAAAAPV